MWVNSTADIIANLFAELWYDLITDIEYESRIKWWTNIFDINISNSRDKFLSKKIDIILAFNNQSLKKQIPSLKTDAVIIINKKWIEKLEKEKILKNTYNILTTEISDKYDNIYLIWILTKFLSIDLEIILSKIEEIFKNKWKEIIEKNQNIVKNIFNSSHPNPLPLGEGVEQKSNLIKINWKFNKKIWEPNHTIYWNKAIAYWAIKWELWYYSAYPMTPASTILTEIINSKKVKYLQAEDEIAVVNSVLWASFTWERAMCWTSGWWFALMSEAISFAVQTEIPLTIVLSQRAWPSTWAPTFTEQWDINYALNPSFGDFNHVVLYPSNMEETYYFSWLALNIADKYQTQVIILMDKQSSELIATHDKLTVPKVDRWVILKNPKEDYKRYEINNTWISPRVEVWTKSWDFIASSYEHDEYWTTNQELENKKLFTEKRLKKLDNFFEKEWYKWYEYIVYDDSSKSFISDSESIKKEKLIITMSFTSYTAKYFIKNNPEFWLIVIKFLKPLDFRLLDEIKPSPQPSPIGRGSRTKEIIFVEQNCSGQLENYIVKEFWLKYIKWLKISNLRKYDLMPFYIEDFEEIK
jgi:2-oxoglutarate/2-oxoacid ferredoxin oxidoreductase subunit alpha